MNPILKVPVLDRPPEKSSMGWFMKQKKSERGCGNPTGAFEIFMTTEGIQALHAASKSWEIRKAITSLNIKIGYFSMKPEKESLTLHPPAWSEADEYKNSFLIGDSDIRLLSQALSNLPNLHQVYVGKGRTPAHVLGGEKYAVDRYAWLEEVNDMRIPVAGHVLRTGGVKSVYEALALSSYCFKRLGIKSDSTVTLGQDAEILNLSFNLPEPILTKLTTKFQNLTRFHFTMAFQEDGNPNTEDERLQLLVRFLTTTSSLESFRLAASKGSVFSSDLIATVRDALPASLREFHLYNSMLTATVLHRVLGLHHRKVTELGLYRCLLVDESWKLFSRTLDMCKSCLKHVYLEELWELRHELQGDSGLSDGWKGFSAQRIYHVDRNMCTHDYDICPFSECASYRKSDFRDDSMFIEDGHVHVRDLNLKVHRVNFRFMRLGDRILCTWMQRHWWSVIRKDLGPYLRDWYKARQLLKEHERPAEK